MKFSKFKNWEYWPSYLFYLPNIPYAVYLALRAKNLVFFSAANPAIKHSGNGSESKYETIQLIPTQFRPTTIFIKAQNPIENTSNLIHKNKLNFPLIIKPDIGFRGLLVNRIKSKEALISYLEKHNNLNLIIQEYIDYANECGIFYHRLPTESTGKITSITLKKYLTIIGNGTSTVKELILNDDRAKLYVDLLTELHQQSFDTVLKKGKEKILNVIGNHSKGTQFINGNYLITPELESAIDTIIQQIPNLYYGRLDLKYNTLEELIALKNFKILEFNGIISEPTHIYDPNNTTYFKALKEIRKHWKILFKVAIQNHRINNVKYDTVSDFLASLNELKKYTHKIKSKINS